MAGFFGGDCFKSCATVEYDWTEITKDFLDSTKNLCLGELVHDGTFGLFEAMSAIEMMDPKMDAGMLCNRASKDRALSYDEAVQRNKIKLADLTWAEQIGIIDATFACLVTWLEGHSLAQTVFTNLYLHRPFETQDVVVRGFSVTILKLVDLLINFVSRANVFEEEDFQAMTYGFSLCNDIPANKASALLKEADDFLLKVKDGCSSEDEAFVDALLARLKFVRMFHQVLICFGKRECSGLPQAAKCAATCVDLCQTLKDSIKLGVHPSGSQTFLESRVDYPTIMGFEPLVNQRLLPPTFPRYTRIVPRDVAYDRLALLMTRLKTVTGITACHAFASALEFMSDFSGQGPCVVSRSILKLTYLPQGFKFFGLHLYADVLRDACKAFIAPPILTNKLFAQTNPESRGYMDGFFCHAFRPFSSLILALSHNRARLRDRLGHLLEEFAALQEEADKLDQCLNVFWIRTYGDQNGTGSQVHFACLGTWVLHHTLKVMVTYLLTGFELELYALHEYHYIFWYLYEFLYGWTISALSRADRLVTEQEALLEAQAPQNQKSRSNKKPAKPKKQRRIRPYAKEIQYTQGLQELCCGYYKVMVGLRFDNKVDQPHHEFDNERVRYEHRFAPFMSVTTPPLVLYDQFLKSTSFESAALPRPAPQELYMDASKCFSQARMLFESLPGFKPDQLQVLVQVAKTNIVVSKLLATGHQRDSSSPVSFDFSLHPHFPVLKFS